jgi:CDP-paratose 2-epimerase
MKVLITGSGGLIGSEACAHWLKKGSSVTGIDNNMRSVFFGPSGDVTPNIQRLSKNNKYNHKNIDIRDRKEIARIIKSVRPDVIIHTAAQPSHDKASEIPFADFDTNAVGTLNLLEATRIGSPDCVFIHVSTNKVYGDKPNRLPLIETEERYDYDLTEVDKFSGLTDLGINECMSIDQSLHSLFGASKASADIISQEYGRYFGMNVGVFRGGCLTGPQHAGVELHGFLSYIVKCAVRGDFYTIFGYKGKQVRDQIHCSDVISAFDQFIENPKSGEVYNIGGCKENSASILEVINIMKDQYDLVLNYKITNKNRSGDHICYYTDMSKFKSDYNSWKTKWPLYDIIGDIVRNFK